ncbi:MAG: hypothetical protein IH577_04515 [Deltaproteobacteria bacterium]|nr:hypothetical protein [Deltaproteobacteria bacterium]
MNCPHDVRRIDGMYPAEKSNEMPMIAFTCCRCRTSTGMPWKKGSKEEQDIALTLGVPGTYRAAGAM